MKDALLQHLSADGGRGAAASTGPAAAGHSTEGDGGGLEGPLGQREGPEPRRVWESRREESHAALAPVPTLPGLGMERGDRGGKAHSPSTR